MGFRVSGAEMICGLWSWNQKRIPALSGAAGCRYSAVEKVLARRGGSAFHTACRELRARRRAAEARLPLPALRSLRRTAQRAFSESLVSLGQSTAPRPV